MVPVLRPALSLQSGDKEGAINELRNAIKLCEENNILFQLAGARYRLAHLLGPEQSESKTLLEAAKRYGSEQKIKSYL